MFSVSLRVSRTPAGFSGTSWAPWSSPGWSSISSSIKDFTLLERSEANRSVQLSKVVDVQIVWFTALFPYFVIITLLFKAETLPAIT